MGASFLKIPELMISESESEALAKSVARVAEFYDFAILSDEAMAWVNLAMVAGGIYGPRFVAATLRPSEEKKPAANVTSWPVVENSGVN